MKKGRRNLILRRVARTLGGLILLFILLILFVRSPWGQDIIVTKATNYISNKTGTEVRIDRLFLTFGGNIYLEGLYLEDKKGDTLLYSKSLEANLPISPIVFSNRVNLALLEWKGVRAKIFRNENTEDFNFSFLIDAFVTAEETPPTAETEPMDITIGTVDLEDFDIVYEDRYLGIDSHLNLGTLGLEADRIDLETMEFELDEVLLYDSRITYKQTKPFITQDSTETPLPKVSVQNLELRNVQADYSSKPDGLLANILLGNFVLKLPKANIADNDFEITSLRLTDSDFYIKTDENSAAARDTIAIPKDSAKFEWPPYKVKADKITFQNNSLEFQSGNASNTEGSFNPEAIAIRALNLEAADLLYRERNAHLEIVSASFMEKSGFQLKELGFEARIDNTSAAISNIKATANNSRVIGDLNVLYSEVDQVISSPETVAVSLDIPNLRLALDDVFLFQPNLAKNDYLKKAAKKTFTGRMKARGTLAAIDISDAQINWGENTNLSVRGLINNVLNTDLLSFDFNSIKASTIRKDLLRFVSEEDLGISVPENITLTAEAEGNLDDINGNILMTIPEGKTRLAGRYSNQGSIQFDGTLKVDSLRLDKLLKNEQLGGISLTMKASGSGNSINTLNATLTSDISQLNLKGYDFSGLQLEGDIVDGKGDINFNFKDRNLNFDANTLVDLDSVNSKIILSLDLIGADLLALGLAKEDIKIATKLKADFTGTPADFKLNAKIFEGIAVYDTKQYQMDAVILAANIDETNTNVTIDSDFLSGTLESNGSPEKIYTALKRQFDGYFSDAATIDTIANPVKLKMNMVLQPTPILIEVFFRGVQQLDSITMQADFDASEKALKAELRLPFANYKGSTIDSLNILVTANSTDLDFTAGLAGLVSGPINIKKTYLEGNLKNKELFLDFLSYDDGKKLIHIASEMALAKDTIQLHINPSELIFNEQDWSIPQNNEISFADNYLNFKNFTLSRNSQNLTISNTIEGIEKEHIGLTLDNFKLQTFLSLLNPDEELLSGLVKGDLIFENPFEAMGIIADFKIDDLEVTGQRMGNLSLSAQSKGATEYDFDLAVKDGRLNLDMQGDYVAAETGARLNLDLAINKLEMGLVEAFSQGNLRDSEGIISGNIELRGTTANPEYVGKLFFDQTNFKIASLGAEFKLSEESIRVDNSGLYFDGFQIDDANNNTFTIDGTVLTEEITNPSFDLTLVANQFQALNSTKEDNELFYGVASFDVDARIGGNLELPKIDGKLRVRKVTEVTYVVPESQLDVEERDGVVIFVNRKNPDAILTRNDQEETQSFFKGFDAEAILEIANDAVFHIIIDERTGDNLQVSGEGALNLNVEPNGRINLTGRYELNSGHYEASLYNLVKRKFEISPGSTITWRGDPLNADMDVTAVYRVETAAAPLMSSVTSGQDASVTGKYRQVLPFLVYLNVDGELLEPKLSFDLDMPEDEQGSLGGAVYGRVQQLNEQEDELNKQVFSLLALNRFYPASGSDGSTGGTAALAKDNVNKVLSGELNAFSDKIFGKQGFEVDFDLDSFTDYQGDTPQERTQLNINAKKKLLNDRLIVTAGSAVDVEGSASTGQEENPIIGNVSLEYLLTENGRYRLKGFRKNEYQNIIDGQLIVTGLAIIFNREFNKFSELFNPLKETKDDDQKDKVEQKE